MVKRAAPIIQRFMRQVESGSFAFPKGWDVLMRYPTEDLRLRHGKPKNLQIHPTNLYNDFYAKYPLAKLQPLQLNSKAKPLSRLFVEQQQQLMREGVSRGDAFVRVEHKLQDKLSAVDGAQRGSGFFLKMAHQEEEQALQRALRSLYTSKSKLVR